MAKAAFYINRNPLIDKTICWRTSGHTSHVELLLDDGLCYSSSWRDGGVRKKRIEMDHHWQLVDIPFANDDAIREFFQNKIGAKYDLPGVLGGQALSIKFHKGSWWFCSEICAEALGLTDSWRYSPVMLYHFLTSMNKYYER